MHVESPGAAYDVGPLALHQVTDGAQLSRQSVELGDHLGHEGLERGIGQGADASLKIVDHGPGPARERAPVVGASGVADRDGQLGQTIGDGLEGLVHALQQLLVDHPQSSAQPSQGCEIEARAPRLIDDRPQVAVVASPEQRQGREHALRLVDALKDAEGGLFRGGGGVEPEFLEGVGHGSALVAQGGGQA